ncbi:IS5 family transposase [Vibrio campbellii]|uniref:IS5 family transposase n=1 Tax=Vibrio campbellii TaxID=680 RepID=UPI001F387BEA|nr:IS5 family transposase [Vibrio campbellii]
MKRAVRILIALSFCSYLQMPNKYNQRKRRHFSKPKFRTRNWRQYNQSLKDRGSIDIWLSKEILDEWQFDKRHYDGTGSTVKYPDKTIEACHHLRMVFKQPLRQAQGFIGSLLKMLGRKNLQCPDYSVLSRRLGDLGLVTPRFKQLDIIDKDIVAIAIDSTGLKLYGKDEWHQEKHNIDAKRSWKKAHFVVRNNHIIESAVMTGKDVMDDQVVGDLCQQIIADVKHITADKMYDTNAVYSTLEECFPNADIVIPPKDNSFADEHHNKKRMQNLVSCTALGVMGWQKKRDYGRRNVSETAMQRYKKIIGNRLYSRKSSNQAQEMLIGCSILNRFTQLGMPNSYRVA